MSKIILHQANSRGSADYGWLKAKYSFSFANYFDPHKIQFGVLRVLNDDCIDPDKGFGMHPHDNMEIITIPLEGELEHKDNMGNTGLIKAGDVQVMSAGTGVYHSEFNSSNEKYLKLFQIWILPNKQNVTPRYEQITLNTADRKNKLQQIISPSPSDNCLWIHQQAWFYIGNYTTSSSFTYQLQKNGNGVYIMVINGSLDVNGNKLATRDAIGICDTNEISIQIIDNAEILIMDIPMF